MKDMCAECGADLRKQDQTQQNASVPMVHSIPELKVSKEVNCSTALMKVYRGVGIVLIQFFTLALRSLNCVLWPVCFFLEKVQFVSW
jgi:hypothetical protein